MASIKFRIIIEKGDAKAAVTDVEAQVDGLKQKAEEPKSLKLDAQAALGVIRYVMLNLNYDTTKYFLTSGNWMSQSI